MAALLALIYIAAEPYARRYWPDSLISWNRLQSGRFRDSLVASHILVGVFTWYLLMAVSSLVWSLLPVRRPEAVYLLSSPAMLVSFVLEFVPRAIAVTMSFLLIIVVLRLLARRRLWIADIIGCVLFGLTGPIFFDTPLAFAVSAAIVFPTIYCLFWLVRRFGFVAILGAWAGRIAIGVPFVPGAWYTGGSLAVALIPAVLAACALWVIVKGDRSPTEFAA